MAVPHQYQLFADTGIQIVCVPLDGVRYQSSQIGLGWQRCRCASAAQGRRAAGAAGDEKLYPFIQWQIIQSATVKLFLAVDTSCGDRRLGFFQEEKTFVHDFLVRIENLLDLQGQPLPKVPPVEIRIQPTGMAGDPRVVHMVVDFGNSRTGALLVERTGELAQLPRMQPFELLNQYQLDAWDDRGQRQGRPADRWFSSKTHWCTTPYLAAERIRVQEPPQPSGKAGGWWTRFLGRAHPPGGATEKVIEPPLFDDYSMVRMGREADDVTQVIRAEGDLRTGVSSPKRYLWADDARWLEGANWFMADPTDRYGTQQYVTRLQGRLLRYIYEDDRDFLLEPELPPAEHLPPEAPDKPRHAPRCLMTAALYELLCQAYSYVNSAAYRRVAGDATRPRRIGSLTLSYPSGMILEERQRFRAQVEKAIRIFSLTVGKRQGSPPQLTMTIDEASAVHLTYLWSELRLLGQNPRLWFAAVGREQRAAPSAAVARASASPRGHIRGGTVDHAPQEVRIACIDIGGGSSDLMIAKYRCVREGIDDWIHGQVLHQDGIALAGDELVKRLLERIIVPAFAEALRMEPEDVVFFFGPETPCNLQFRTQRIRWMNRLFVPLAHAYLDRITAEEYHRPIAHTDPEIVDPAILDTLQRVFDQRKGPGYYNAREALSLQVSRDEFENLAWDVFEGLLVDYCQRIVKHQADLVLLAGLPSKLACVQEMVRSLLPLSPSRVVPMHGHYAGNWYPYQEERNPGVIVDPKSPVVVGAAIDLFARHGMLPQFHFKMKDKTQENSYYWGVMLDAITGIRGDRILFAPAEVDGQDYKQLETSSLRVLIGRKLSPSEGAQASPVYLLRMDPGERIGTIQVRVGIQRSRAGAGREETLQVVSVEGEVAGEPARLGQNVFFTWRTLADERYYLDTGALDNIEYPRAANNGWQPEGPGSAAARQSVFH